MVTLSEVLEVIVVSMRDAFLAVTVFVAAMVLLFSWLQYITAGKFVDAIRANKRWQPVIGALMGITPGCGGAIVMMPMYARGYVTYGTVIATLIATLGDAAFVLIGAAVTDSSFIAPVIAVHLISLFVGIFWGYLVDVLEITPRNPLGKYGPEFELGIDYNPLTLHGFITWIGLLGTSLSILLYISQKNWIRDDTEASIGDKLYSMRETMIHSASETAFVTFWVMAAYLVFEFSMLFSGMTEADLARYGDGFIAVVLAAFIGLIPGCGPQIIAITAYTKDVISFPALAANAISQDGDALFPLLVRHRAASLWATVHTTIPALVVGIVLMVFGVTF